MDPFNAVTSTHLTKFREPIPSYFISSNSTTTKTTTNTTDTTSSLSTSPSSPNSPGLSITKTTSYSKINSKTCSWPQDRHGTPNTNNTLTPSSSSSSFMSRGRCNLSTYSSSASLDAMNLCATVASILVHYFGQNILSYPSSSENTFVPTLTSLDERALWNILKDGVILVRLVQLLLKAAPSVQVNPQDAHENILAFLRSLPYSVACEPEAQFIPSHVLQYDHIGFRHVLTTIIHLDRYYHNQKPDPDSNSTSSFSSACSCNSSFSNSSLRLQNAMSYSDNNGGDDDHDHDQTNNLGNDSHNNQLLSNGDPSLLRPSPSIDSIESFQTSNEITSSSNDLVATPKAFRTSMSSTNSASSLSSSFASRSCSFSSSITPARKRWSNFSTPNTSSSCTPPSFVFPRQDSISPPSSLSKKQNTLTFSETEEEEEEEEEEDENENEEYDYDYDEKVGGQYQNKQFVKTKIKTKQPISSVQLVSCSSSSSFSSLASDTTCKEKHDQQQDEQEEDSTINFRNHYSNNALSTISSPSPSHSFPPLVPKHSDIPSNQQQPLITPSNNPRRRGHRIIPSSSSSIIVKPLPSSSSLSTSSSTPRSSITTPPPNRQKIVFNEPECGPITFQLGERIGQGQFGSVFKALNLNSGRVVAIKRISLEGKANEEIEELTHEVQVLKSVAQHPGIVQYEGLVQTLNHVNIIMEYVENGSLLHTLKAFGNLPEGLVASYVVKILEGLHYLHSNHIVHCDLKAANILTTKNGNIKLSDFGVSLNLKALQNTNNITHNDYNTNKSKTSPGSNSTTNNDNNNVAGSPNWMAPEVIQLNGASTASDIWSLGCTIIELCTGSPPYADLVTLSAMFHIVEDAHPPIPNDISKELGEFLIYCFHKTPSDRPQAQALSDHEWLQKNWDPVKDLRPQDSIPFLRRISNELRRLEDGSNSILSNSSSISSICTSTPEDIYTEDPFNNYHRHSRDSHRLEAHSKLTGDHPSSSYSPSPSPSSLSSPSPPPLPSAIKWLTASTASAVTSPSPTNATSHHKFFPSSSSSSSPLTSHHALSKSARSKSAHLSIDVETANIYRKSFKQPSSPATASILNNNNNTNPSSPSAMLSSNKINNNNLNNARPKRPIRTFSCPSAHIKSKSLDDHAENRSHNFIKSHFSKVVICKICRMPVKKNAYLCEDCGLLCHSKCANELALPCDLGIRFLFGSNDGHGTMTPSEEQLFYQNRKHHRQHSADVRTSYDNNSFYDYFSSKSPSAEEQNTNTNTNNNSKQYNNFLLPFASLSMTSLTSSTSPSTNNPRHNKAKRQESARTISFSSATPLSGQNAGHDHQQQGSRVNNAMRRYKSYNFASMKFPSRKEPISPSPYQDVESSLPPMTPTTPTTPTTGTQRNRFRTVSFQNARQGLVDSSEKSVQKGVQWFKDKFRRRKFSKEFDFPSPSPSPSPSLSRQEQQEQGKEQEQHYYDLSNDNDTNNDYENHHAHQTINSAFSSRTLQQNQRTLKSVRSCVVSQSKESTGDSTYRRRVVSYVNTNRPKLDEDFYSKPLPLPPPTTTTKASVPYSQQTPPSQAQHQGIIENISTNSMRHRRTQSDCIIS